ncbi:MAG: glycosyltransferase family 4 protein [Pseudomonadota bacterium]
MEQRQIHILHVFDGFRCGGTELRTCRILNGLKGKYKHTICTLSGNVDASIHLEPSVQFSLVHPESASLDPPLNFFHIIRLLLKVRPDLMIAYAWGPIDWLLVNSLFRVCPSIHAAEGFDDSETFSRKPRRELIRRVLFNNCAKVVTCSRLLEKLALQSWKLDRKKVIYIPNGVQPDNFLHRSNRRENHSDPVQLGIVASLIKLKNHSRLIRCLSRMTGAPSVVLHIAGEGPEKQMLQRLCNNLGVSEKVRFAGHMGNPSILLEQLDIFCLSSDVEQMPMAVLEAMAAGLPIVSTAVGDIREMVSLENRPFIVRPEIETDYQMALETLIRDRRLRHAIGVKNRIRCGQFYTEERMINRYDSLYTETASGKNQHSRHLLLY